MSDVIVAQNVSKWFRRYHAGHPNTLKEAILHGWRWVNPVEQFWALRDVSLSVPAGRTVGLIGPNGAGKSTLLRLIGGVGKPDGGSVSVRGRISALFDLGAGFHPDLTGRENVFVSGIITGLTRRDVVQRFDSIVEFAELEAFIDNPLRTYSTGMRVRLAFAIAAHVDPEILLIDEVLAVGDLSFQRKCLERITQFKAEGCTIVIVSHDAQSIQRLCDEVLWLRQGQVAAYGPAEVVTGQYVVEMSAETRRRTPASISTVRASEGGELKVNENRFGSLEVEIVGVHLLDRNGLPAKEIDSGDPLSIEIKYFASKPVDNVIFGVTISRGDGLVCYDTSTENTDCNLQSIQGEGGILFQLERLDLIGNEYFIDVGAYEKNWAYAYDYHWHVYSIVIRPTKGEKGILRPPSYWTELMEKSPYSRK
jgi:homopolymeric O-antigen transport system ATP-binding protein